jgi:hypothetical protein
MRKAAEKLCPSSVLLLLLILNVVYLCWTTPAQAKWSSIGPDGVSIGGSIACVAIDPQDGQTIYAGTGSGVFKSTNGGTSWSQLNAGLPTNTNIQSLAIDHQDTQTIYAGTSGGGVFKSTDGGGPTLPGAPTAVKAKAGNAQATVTFKAPASDGGSPIIWYTVISSPGGIIETGAASPIKIKGLTNGKAYTFTVRATNAIGTGPASKKSNIVVPIGPPTAPTGVKAKAGNAQATVTFKAPASDGGSPIISYTVISIPGGKKATGTSSPITVKKLTNGTVYTFTVKATNAVGTGPASKKSNSIVPIGPVSVTDTSPNGVLTSGNPNDNPEDESDPDIQ